MIENILVEYGLTGVVILILLGVIKHIQKREEQTTNEYLNYVKEEVERKVTAINEIQKAISDNTASLEKLNEKIEERTAYVVSEKK